MQLPTLFSKREGGGLQQWTIEVDDGSRYRTISGMVGGKLQISEWTIAIGKNLGKINATDGHSQAVLEAQARWDKRVELGDREDPTDLGNDGIFWPMLARKFDDYADDIKYPVLCQPKLNGFRVVARKSGVFSRNGKRFHCLVHLERILKPVFEQYPDLIIDGEGYADEFKADFNKIGSLIKKTKPTPEDIAEAEKYLRFHVYDCYDAEHQDTIFSNRMSFIRETLYSAPYIKLVDTFTCSNKVELDTYYKSFLAAGYEGEMIRLDKPYENKRSKNLLKRKQFKDAEFRIVEVLAGMGNLSGVAGSMVCRLPDGRLFHANIKGNFAWKGQLWKDRKTLIGKKATVKFFDYTPINKDGDKGGVPLFPFAIAIRDYE